MTFEDAYQKLQETFPNSYIILSYERNPYTYELRGYVEGNGWTEDYKTIEEVIMQLQDKEMAVATTGPVLDVEVG